MAADDAAQAHEGDEMITLEEITAAVSVAFNVSVGDMRGPYRTMEYVEARQCAFVLARKNTKLSLPQIGRYFGGRDHTTVLHGLRSFPKREKKFPEIRRKREKAEDNIAFLKGPAWRNGSFIPVFKSVRTK